MAISWAYLLIGVSHRTCQGSNFGGLLWRDMDMYYCGVAKWVIASQNIPWIVTIASFELLLLKKSIFEIEIQYLNP